MVCLIVFLSPCPDLCDVSRKDYNVGVKFRARALTTLPDSTSQKFLLLASVARKDQTKDISRTIIVHLDFSKTRQNKCGESDFEPWYARSSKTECLMGHKVRLASYFLEEQDH